jgi:hypothetical protein
MIAIPSSPPKNPLLHNFPAPRSNLMEATEGGLLLFSQDPINAQYLTDLLKV